MRRFSILVVTVVLAACGGGGGKASSDTTTTTAAPSTTVSTFGGVPGVAQELACTQSVSALQQASDFYTATNGSPAPSLDALIADGHVQVTTPSPNAGYTLGYDAATGHVSATGACTVP